MRAARHGPGRAPVDRYNGGAVERGAVEDEQPHNVQKAALCSQVDGCIALWGERKEGVGAVSNVEREREGARGKKHREAMAMTGWGVLLWQNRKFRTEEKNSTRKQRD